MQSDSKIVVEWFSSDQIIVNLGKSQHMLFAKRKPLKVENEGFKLESTKSVKLLGSAIDHNINFDTHISNVYQTTSAKIKSLSRIRNPLDGRQAKLLYNSILSHFNYCSLIWMFCIKDTLKAFDDFKNKQKSV